MDAKSILVGVFAGTIVFGGIGYYVGTKHAASAAGARQFGAAGNFRTGTAGPNGVRAGGFIGGEIIAKDAQSITLKMQNGSTKIVLMSTSSQVTKSAAGSVADLSVGTHVTVTGAENVDGSLTAQTVQIRPTGVPAGEGRTSQ